VGFVVLLSWCSLVGMVLQISLFAQDYWFARARGWGLMGRYQEGVEG
jgi:hypothetical protein